MPAKLLVFLFMMGIALIAWLLFRSRVYREALEDLEGMRKAPENHMKPSGLQDANPFYQLANQDDRRKPKR